LLLSQASKLSRQVDWAITQPSDLTPAEEVTWEAVHRRLIFEAQQHVKLLLAMHECIDADDLGGGVARSREADPEKVAEFLESIKRGLRLSIRLTDKLFTVNCCWESVA
jgi:hypothetical protein